MPLYRGGGSNLPQLANQAMNSATSAMANQSRQTTTVRKKESSFWDDLAKGASAVGSIASAVNNTVGAVDKGIDLYDKIRVKGAYDDIAKAWDSGGYEAIQNNPDMQDYHHSVALGNFVKDRSNTEKGRNEIMKNAEEAADRAYANYRAQALVAHDAWQKGNMDAFRQSMAQLMGMYPAPYKYEIGEDGNFREMFRSDKAGGWTATGKIVTPQEAHEQMLGMLGGEQMQIRGANMQPAPVNRAFNEAAARWMLKTMEGNALNRTDPKRQTPLYDRNGNLAGLGVIQNPLDDYSAGPRIYAYGNNGRQLGVFDGYGQVLEKAGLSPYRNREAGRRGHGHGRSRGRGAPAVDNDEKLLRQDGRLQFD